MSVIGDVFGAGGISQLIQSVINKIVPDKNVQEQVALALQQNATQVQQMQDDFEVKLNDIAGQNIRAEATSGDRFESRARPAIIWGGLLIIFWDYALIPTVSMLWKFTVPNILLPQFFWEVWGVVATGYVMSRGLEKISAMSGDSNISVAGGLIKVGQKSS